LTLVLVDFFSMSIQIYVIQASTFCFYECRKNPLLGWNLTAHIKRYKFWLFVRYFCGCLDKWCIITFLVVICPTIVQSKLCIYESANFLSLLILYHQTKLGTHSEVIGTLQIFILTFLSLLIFYYNAVLLLSSASLLMPKRHLRRT